MPNTTIQLKKSSTPSAKPTDLANGELAINFADGKLFYKNTANYIAEFTSGVNSFGTVNANSTLIVSDTSGDILTLVPGNNITIVGDAINDKITIGLADSVGIGTNSPTSPLHVSSATFPVARIERSTALTSGSRSSFASVHKTTGDMTDTFGTDISFIIRDNANVDNEIALFGARRDGADNSGHLFFNTYNAGVSSTKMYIKPDGNVGIGNTAPPAKLTVDGSLRFAGDGAGGNWLEFSRTASNAWKLDSQGVGTVATIAGNLLTIPQDTLIQRGGLTVTPTLAGQPTALTLNHTFNSTSTRFQALKINVTENGSLANSTLLSASVNNNVSFSVVKSTSGYAGFSGSTLYLKQSETSGFGSEIYHSGNESIHFKPYNTTVLMVSAVDFTPSVQIAADKTFGWSTNAGHTQGDLVFARDAAATFAQRNGANSQIYRLYGTYTDASNYERLSLSANSSGHYIIGEEAGTGSARPLYLGANNKATITIDTAGRVGFGTTPGEVVDIQGGYANGLRVRGPTVDGNWYGGIQLTNTTAAAVGGQIYASTNGLFFAYNSNISITIDPTGKVGIGTTTPAYKLEVAGSFAAQTKSFVIDHQSKPNHKLRHGSLEGPENGVYVRGRTDANVIELPEYWTWLVDEDSITVSLTSIGKHQKLVVEKIKNNKVYIKNASTGKAKIDCFYMINAERKDVDKLIVEY